MSYVFVSQPKPLHTRRILKPQSQAPNVTPPRVTRDDARTTPREMARRRRVRRPRRCRRPRVVVVRLPPATRAAGCAQLAVIIIVTTRRTRKKRARTPREERNDDDDDDARTLLWFGVFSIPRPSVGVWRRDRSFP